VFLGRSCEQCHVKNCREYRQRIHDILSTDTILSVRRAAIRPSGSTNTKNPPSGNASDARMYSTGPSSLVSSVLVSSVCWSVVVYSLVYVTLKLFGCSDR